MVGGLVRPSGTLDHAQLLGDKSVTAFKRPPRGGLGRLEESELKIRIYCLPAPPKAPPRHCSRGASWAGRLNHQGEPNAPGLPLSVRCAAACLCATPPTTGLSAQHPYRTPAVALARSIVRHRLTSVWAGYEQLQVTKSGRVRPDRLLASWPPERLRRPRKGHLVVRIRRRCGLLNG